MVRASDEAAAWLDLAEYARELSDCASTPRSKQTMLGIAVLCESLAFRNPDGVAAGNPAPVALRNDELRQGQPG